MKKYLFLLALCLTAGTLRAASPEEEMRTVRERMVRASYETAHTHSRLQRIIREKLSRAQNSDNIVETVREDKSDENVRRFLESMAADGSWSDLDYADKRRSSWSPCEHARRVMLMSCAYANPESAYHRDAAMRKAVLSAMDYWFAGKFVCSNWWYNQIGVPRLLGPAFLIMQPEMSERQQEEAVACMSNAKIGMTGQNKVWLAGNVLIRALLQNDAELFGKAANAIREEVTVSEREGIQPDWSFHQHGAQPQFGNYGLAYAHTLAGWARTLQGTRYALPPGETEILRNLIVEGMSRIVWKGYMDVNACGRQLFQKAQQGKALGYGEALLDMMQADPARKELYARLYAWNLLGEGEDPVGGFRAFNRSDLSLFRSREWMGSLKMSSERVIPYEIINSENIQGMNLGDGALMLYRTGGEYDNLFPVWEWRRIPGVTAVYRDGGHFPTEQGKFKNGSGHSRNALAGSLAGPDGRCGVSAMSVERPELQAKKSWFFCDGYILCLGSGIRSEADTVYTSLNQCRTDGKFKQRTQRGFQRVEHGGIGYLVPDSLGLTARIAPQSGRWSDVAKFYLDTATVREKVFSLYIDHGQAPRNGSYAYAVVPAPSGTAYKKAGRAQVTVCDEKAHAVLHADGTRQIVCFEAGRIRLNDKVVLTVSGPCLLLMQPDGNGRWQAAAADPTHRQTEILLTFEDGEERNEYRIDTADKDGAARTITVSSLDL